MKRIVLLCYWIFFALVLFSEQQDTTYHKLLVIVDGINRIDGKLLTIAMTQENYNPDGEFIGRGDLLDITDYTMEVEIDSLRAGEYYVVSFIPLTEEPLLEYPACQYAFSRVNGIPLDVDIKHGEPKILWPEFEKMSISIPETKIIRLILSNNKKQ